MTPSPTAMERAEQLADRMLADRTERKRMLVIVNPWASTVSDRLRTLVLYALEARYEVDVLDTEAQGHATQLCREAADEGYDVVAAFGGDGTVNEAANGLVGSDTPLTILPGGATNVFCRVLGIPADIVDATEALLETADRFEPRRIDLGRIGDRYFTFAAGAGLDADVVERVERRPRLKRSLGPWYYAAATVATFNRGYLTGGPDLIVDADGEQVGGATVIVQNCDPYTYFGPRPISIHEGVGLADGRVGLTVLHRTGPLELPTVAARALLGKPSAVARHRRVSALTATRSARIRTRDPERTFAIQVDGDLLGRFSEIELEVAAGALSVVA